MSIGNLFWVLVIVFIVVRGFGWYNSGENRSGWGFGGFFVEFVLICLLGWQVFGSIVQK